MTKTGTSFLQQKIFSRCANANYLHGEYPEILKCFKTNREYTVPENSKRIIFSHEAIYPKNHEQMSTFLLKTFHKSRILLTIRNPKDWIKSFYFQFIKSHGETLNLQEWVKKHDDLIQRHYNFSEFYDIYSKKFGADNILILPYELMVIDFDLYLDTVLKFSGIRAIKKDHLSKIKEARMINKSPDFSFTESFRGFNIALEGLAKDLDLPSNIHAEFMTITKKFRVDLAKLISGIQRDCGDNGCNQDEFLDDFSNSLMSDQIKFLNSVKGMDKVVNLYCHA